MARISSYLNDGSLSGEDRLVGSNYIGVNNYQTNNFKLKDVSEFIQGQISISPSNSTLKTNGGVVTEIINGTSSLAIDLSATDITGQLANSDLANSSITINGTAVSLGGTITIGEVTEVTAGTYLNGGGTEGTVTLNHDDTTRTDTVSTDAPAYGDTFTVIDSLTTNSTGHVTAANVKTVTIPASDNTTYTIEAVASTNDSIIRLIDSDSNNDDIKLIAGDNISLSTNESNDTITINSQAFGTVFTVATESAMITATTTGGDIVIRTDVSKTFIHNGGSAGDVTDFSELQFSGINSIALTEGNGIELSRATLTNVDNDLTITNTLATTTERGGIQIGYTESGKNYPVELDSEKAYVNVPWANTNQLTTFTVRDSGDDDKLVAHGDFIKFVSATGTAGTNLSGTGTTSDPFVMTITSPDANTEYTSGGGLDLNGTVFSHTDTSAQESVDNSGRTYIQDITLDTYGHVTGLVSATETVTDTNQLTTWDLLDDDDDSFTIGHDTHVKFTSSEATYGTNVTGAGTEADPYIVAVTSPNDTVPNSFRTIKVDTDNDGTANETIDAAEELKLIGGTNVTLAEDAGKVTVTSSDTTNWNFKVDSGTAENIAASNTVTFTSGDGITLTQTDKTIDIAADFDGDYNSLTNKPTIPSGNQIIDWSVSQSGNTPAVINTDNYSNTQLSNTQVVAAIVASTDISGTDKGTFRTNIGAGTSSFDGDYDSLSNKPTLLQLGTTSSTALAGDTTIITQTQADAIVNNTAKVSFPGLGTTSTTALAGDTALFSGDYDDLSNKPTIPSGNAIIDWTIDQGDTNIDAGNYSNTQNTAAEIRTKVGTGNNGVVPAAGTAGHFLKHDGTFGLPSYTTNTNYYLDDITKSGNTLTFSVSGADNQTYTFGSNAFNSTAYLTAEADTLATVTGRGASTSTDTTFNSHLTMGGAGHYLYAISNAASVNPTHTHGLAFSWNRSGGSRESNIIFAPGSDASSTEEADAQIRFSYKAVNGTISTAAKLWSGGNFNTSGYITVQNGANAITNARVGQWNTAYGWGNHADEGYSTFSGSYVDLTNKPTIPTNYLRDNADDTSSGSLTVVSYKFNGNTTNPTNTTATIYDQSGVGLTASAHNFSIRNYNGSSMVESARFTTSSLTVIGDVVAFGTPSDVSFKENIKPIENALDKVKKLQGVTFDWKESDSILDIKQDIGFIAQDVQKVLPELVRENDNGKLSLRHQGIIPVLLEAIKELSDKIKVLENGSTK